MGPSEGGSGLLEERKCSQLTIFPINYNISIVNLCIP